MDFDWTRVSSSFALVFFFLIAGLCVERVRWVLMSRSSRPTTAFGKPYVVLSRDDYMVLARASVGLVTQFQWQNPTTAPKDRIFVGLLDINGPYWETCIWDSDRQCYVDSFSAEPRRIYGWMCPNVPDRLPVFPVAPV